MESPGAIDGGPDRLRHLGRRPGPMTEYCTASRQFGSNRRTTAGKRQFWRPARRVQRADDSRIRDTVAGPAGASVSA